MEDRFKINKRRENMIYLACFLLSGTINIAFWISLPGIIADTPSEDVPFIFLAGFAAAGSIVGLTIHYLMFRNITKD